MKDNFSVSCAMIRPAHITTHIVLCSRVVTRFCAISSMVFLSMKFWEWKFSKHLIKWEQNVNKGKNDTLFKDGDPKNHLPYRRSRKTFPQTSLAARSEYRRLYSQTAICLNGKRKLMLQNPGYKPRHGYRSIHMFLIILTITIVTF